MSGPVAINNCIGSQPQLGKWPTGLAWIANRQTIDTTRPASASDRKLFAVRLLLLMNANNNAKLSPVMIAAMAVRS